MNEILLSKDPKQDIDKLPEKPGVFYFSNELQPLFVSLASNLKGRIAFYLDSMKEDDRFIALRDTATKLYWEEATNNLTALIWHKKLVKKLEPLLQPQVKPYEDYCYLAIDFEGDKKIQIKENTQGNLFYIGPFRDRFFVADLVETFKNLLQIKDDKQFSNNLLIETFLRSGNTFLAILEKRREDLFKEIKFQDSESMKAQIDVVAKFYQYMIFYYTARYINTTIDIDESKITIKNGFIEKIEGKGKIEEFRATDTSEYRENEFLALDKGDLDELWIVFFELVSSKKEIITSIYQENIRKVLTTLKYKPEEIDHEN
ncbi:MAG: hypothetical protein P9L91_03770 [Candidatus Zophobacter franzmannii]|jgi:hypothetical protein|nr:hypothetical protein [Candidatus Zophobacter franzmannii]